MDNFQSNCMIQQLCDVLIFRILYFVGILKCSLLFINKLKWKQKFVDDFYIVVLLLSSVVKVHNVLLLVDLWNQQKKRERLCSCDFIYSFQSIPLLSKIDEQRPPSASCLMCWVFGFFLFKIQIPFTKNKTVM